MQIVPQYIDVEDKIVGPLTWKHLGWMFGGAGLLAVAFVTLDNVTFYIVATIIIVLIGALSFYKPLGIPFIDFLGYGFTYLFQPKKYIWKREILKEIKKKKKSVQIKTSSSQKEVTTEDVAALARTLDSGGQERSDRIKQLIKERSKNKK